MVRDNITKSFSHNPSPSDKNYQKSYDNEFNRFAFVEWAVHLSKICIFAFMRKNQIRSYGFSDETFFIHYKRGELCWFDKDEFILMFLDYCTYLGVDHKDLTSDMFDEFVNYGNEHFLGI